MILSEQKWLVRALVALAKRNLADANATPEVRAGAWPAGQEWHELGSTSQHAFMRAARAEAGINHDDYRRFIEHLCRDVDENGELDELWLELEKPNVELSGGPGTPGTSAPAPGSASD